MIVVCAILIYISYRILIFYLPQILSKYNVIIEDLTQFLTFSLLSLKISIKDLFLKGVRVEVKQFGWSYDYFKLKITFESIKADLDLNLIDLEFYNMFMPNSTKKKTILKNVNIIQKFVYKNQIFMSKKPSPETPI